MKTEKDMSVGIVGGAMLPHAPQFFTLPETEDRGTVERVKRVAGQIGEGLRALKPDVWIIVSNDHAQQFFQDCAPPFTLHVGGRATGTFAGRKFEFEIASDLAFRLVRDLYRDDFDPAFSSTAEVDYAQGIPLTHLGVTNEPILPIFVNAYLPPQPTMERCYAFGRALGRAVALAGVRAVVIASGGMSHFPGTDRYSEPCLEWDKAALERLERGNLRSLMAYDESELDDTGNIELRCWAVAAGALGERKPDIAQLDPSWHHNYASLGWMSSSNDAAHVMHYPSIRPELVGLTDALHALAHDEQARTRYLDDPARYAIDAGVAGEQASALAALDVPRIVQFGVHPLVPFLARMQIDRLTAKD
jgi:2,3-dihydroxyphenylpropionate 1,2-dioxygenase